MTQDLEARIHVVSASPVELESKPASGRRGWLGIVALIALVAVGFMSQLSYAVSRLTVFPPGGAATDTEFSRFTLSGWPNASIVENVRNVIPEDDITLVFRQAEFGFYGERPFIFYLDEAIAPVFRLPSADAIAAALKERGVRWIMIPDYGLTEINETKFVDLFARPDICELVVSNGGYRLFHLTDAPRPFVSRQIAGGGFGTSDASAAVWSVVSTTNGVTSRTPRASLERLEDGLLMAATSLPGLNTRDVSYLARGSLAADAPMNVVPRSDIPLVEGPVLLSMDVEGRGNIELRIVTGREGAANEYRTIWSGALLGERRTIKGVYLDAGFLTQGLNAPTRRHRIQLSLRGPGEVKARSWRADFLEPPTPPWSGEKRWTLADTGWMLSGVIPPPPKGQFSMTRIKEDVVQLSQQLPADITADAPWMALPGLEIGKGDAGMGLGPLAERLPVNAWLDVELSGEGAANVGVRAMCPDGRMVYVPMGSVALEAAPQRVYREQTLDCLPILLRLVVTATLDIYHVSARPTRSRVEIHPAKVGTWIRWGQDEGRSFTYVPYGSIIANAPIDEMKLPADDAGASPDAPVAVPAGAAKPQDN